MGFKYYVGLISKKEFNRKKRELKAKNKEELERMISNLTEQDKKEDIEFLKAKILSGVAVEIYYLGSIFYTKNNDMLELLEKSKIDGFYSTEKEFFITNNENVFKDLAKCYYDRWCDYIKDTDEVKIGEDLKKHYEVFNTKKVFGSKDNDFRLIDNPLYCYDTLNLLHIDKMIDFEDCYVCFWTKRNLELA